MKYDAAVRITIDAQSEKDAANRIEAAIVWLGFGCEIVHIVPSAGQETQ